MEQATFGAGCFWGVEATFRKKLEGRASVSVGYSGGTTQNPTYQEVCRGNTGHTEVVHIEYDPQKVSYEELLSIFWKCHNPTTLNRQGPDIGWQYRSVIFFYNEQQEKLARQSKQQMEESKQFNQSIVTAIEPASPFYRAEEYHQCYVEKQAKRSCSS